MSHVTDSFSKFQSNVWLDYRDERERIVSEKGYSAESAATATAKRWEEQNHDHGVGCSTIDPVARSCRRSGYGRPASDARNPHDGALDLTISVLPRFPFRPADRPDWTRIRGAKVHIANSSNCPESPPTDGSFLTRSDKGPGKIGQCWIRG